MEPQVLRDNTPPQQKERGTDPILHEHHNMVILIFMIF
jgi:hypothetical protein